MLCISCWIDYETSSPFITLTDNWNWTWFGAHICWNDTRLIIFFNKDTIVKLFLYKTDRNVHFNSSGRYFSFNNRNKFLLFSHCNVGALVWSAMDSMYLCITLFFLIAFWMYLIYLSLESEDISGVICTFQKTATPTRVWKILKTDRLLLKILALSTSWWHSNNSGFCSIQLDTHLMLFWWHLFHHKNKN